MRNFWTKIRGQLHWSKIKNYALGHKIISLIFLLVLVYAGYRVYSYYSNTSGQTHYVISAVQKGTIISTVSGSGQVSALRQLELKPKASGDIIYLGVKSGQMVGMGQLLAQIDARDALLNLENAKLALSKLTEPADKLSIIQAENALASAIDSRNQAYSSGFNAMDAAFLDLPTVMTGLETLFTNYNSSTYFTNEASLSDTAKIYRQTASASFYRAKMAYDKNVTDYRGVGRTAASSTMQALVVETTQTAKLVAQALKETNTAISFIINQTDSRNKTTAMTTDTANINTWTTEMNSHVTSLNSIADTLSSSARTIADKQESLIKLQEGADKLDIRSQELAVEQKQNTYNDYFIRAPFAGMVQINVNVGDSASGGVGLGTIVSAKKIATVSLNEVDIAKVKVGQKATLTFDAIDSLSISGEVAEVDIVGTVSQGVVNYNVKISFDTQDERIKSGMSASALIAFGVKQEVLKIPSSAIKKQGETRYVEVFDRTMVVTDTKGVTSTILPTRKTIEVGIADDLNTEIMAGLIEGDKVVTKTILATAQTTTAKAPSLLGGGSGSRAGSMPH